MQKLLQNEEIMNIDLNPTIFDQNVALKERNLKAKNQDAEKLSLEIVTGFWQEFLKTFPENTKSNPRFGGGKAEETFKSLLIPEQAKLLASQDISGLKAHVTANILSLQNVGE